MKTASAVVFIMGPTAGGKTALAVELCQRLPFGIISVDSAMIYRGMNIGTAKPGPEILQIAPHRLIDICDAAEIYSAGKFRLDALQAIEEMRQQGKIPLLVGGTGLYFRALEQGISALPAADPVIREILEREASVIGWQGMHQRLAGIDSDSAARIHPNDPQRIQRALELFEITGKSRSALFAVGGERPLPYQVCKIIIAPAERNIIQEQVKQRFKRMLVSGLVEEVQGFYQRADMHAALPSMRMVGYRQVWRFLTGLISYQEMQDHAIVATRQLAKRQLTWLRSEQNGVWLDATDPDLLNKTLKYLQKDRNIAAKV
ncbi:MAG: tRNA (adenosine(37)-N6)-dimethylallyltransferase MiaA [Gammaproteobacteria bacterium RIFCSPLOWO2_12_FULL_52_10]|nr:MAG: tRNA (adenosine(37)-N6)-dimethylallyltransferase MiaA [Gammaproteobacteria bacterium RIFCSPLOWO2_12_FULL_52_10]